VRHIDLFSGIGGFALAAQEVWGEEYENVCFCEINKYAQAVLRNQFGKDAVIYGDIRGLTAYAHKQVESALPSDAIPRAGMPESSCAIDLLTGGFPCQPFSQAGKRKGVNDDRYLWPEMLRVIREFHPTWVVAENVRGLLTISEGVVFEQVCLDLENEGYEVQPFVIPACAVNAPHRRDRVWIVAHSQGGKPGQPPEREGREGSCGGNQEGGDVANRNNGGPSFKKLETAGNQQCDRGDSASNPEGIGWTSIGHPVRKESEDPMLGSSDKHENVSDSRSKRSSGSVANEKGLEGSARTSEEERENGRASIGGWSYWSENWLEVATRFCGVDDGLPGEMDGVTLSKAGHRVERLKALGNAIVPQVAIQIFRGLKMAEVMESI